MNDEQWSKLTALLKVPAAARVPIENELDWYARFADAVAPPPNETKKKLERAAALASELLHTLEGLGRDVQNALCASEPITAELLDPAAASKLARLVGRPRATPRRDAHILLAEHHAQLTALRDCMSTAATRIARGKTGSDASNVRALIRHVSKIIEKHTGKPLGKGKREFDFALELCKLADPQIRIGSIKAAIEDLNSEKLASENSANLG